MRTAVANISLTLPLMALVLAGVGAIDTKIAFGSCNKQMYGGLWKQVARESPDYLILLGDNVYNDVRNNLGQWEPASVEAIRQSYDALRADEGWSALSSRLGREKIFATWDDHDYGLDNGDKTFINREKSLETFLNFFSINELDFKKRMSRGGVYQSHVVPITRGKNKKDFIIKIIMMDTRYFKDPKGSSLDADILGAEQWSWLENEINGSTDETQPDLILLGSSIQVLATQKIFEETWSDYPPARERLLNLITNAPCRNVFILSGDVHMMEVSQASCRGTNTFGQERQLFELTSSGLSQTFINYLKKPDDSDEEPTILTKGKILQALYDAYEASYPGKYRENKYKDFYQGVHFATLDIVLPDDASTTEESGIRFNVINHLSETVYSSFYPFIFQPFEVSACTSSTDNSSSSCLANFDQDLFTYNSERSEGYQCTPRWGHEKPFEYFLHVFCMACFMFVVLALPSLTVLWFIFASCYYVWFIAEDRRRARIEAMHDKKV